MVATVHRPRAAVLRGVYSTAMRNVSTGDWCGHRNDRPTNIRAVGATHVSQPSSSPDLFAQRKQKTTPVTPGSSRLAVSIVSLIRLSTGTEVVRQNKVLPVSHSQHTPALLVPPDLHITWRHSGASRRSPAAVLAAAGIDPHFRACWLPEGEAEVARRDPTWSLCRCHRVPSDMRTRSYDAGQH